MEKITAYKQLVEKRKKHKFSDGLINPSETPYDIAELDPWAQWQNNLNARILVIGQENCDVKTYNKVEAKVERYVGKYEYPSNENLKEFLCILGYDIGHPTSPKKQPIFLTNAVMGLKTGTMSSNFQSKWLAESRDEFLKPLIDIIQPEIIIAVGAEATKTLGVIYNFKVEAQKNMVEKPPIERGNTKIFPVFHTGRLSSSTRPKAQQKEDWQKIKSHL